MDPTIKTGFCQCYPINALRRTRIFLDDNMAFKTLWSIQLEIYNRAIYQLVLIRMFRHLTFIGIVVSEEMYSSPFLLNIIKSQTTDLKESFAESAFNALFFVFVCVFQLRNQISFISIKHPLYVRENCALKQPENHYSHSGKSGFLE